ncbi:hypothetical protein HID58_055766 [Brassica napus]|uniref:Secreted protein n=2 Tax=Brassica napus TaxID=3708 RepID=A0ABQ8ALF1_BRANA|nr:hypothetical protein HID58_055766 [Brassica napus]
MTSLLLLRTLPLLYNGFLSHRHQVNIAAVWFLSHRHRAEKQHLNDLLFILGKHVFGWRMLRHSYHQYSKEKIGCGHDFIMVDRHPQFRHSRCLFLVRTDGGWIVFSYQKCLRDYVRDRYRLMPRDLFVNILSVLVDKS